MKLLLGDCLIKLKELEDNSIDAIVTDPPYGLSFMGKKWDYDVPKMEVWKECLRVLKPGGYLLSFAGTRTQHRMAVNIEDAGFEIRDMIAWVYGSGFPKSLNIGKAVDKLQGNERIEFQRTDGAGNKQDYLASDRTKSEAGVFGGDKQVFRDSKGTSEWEGWGTALKPAVEPITVARKPLGEKSVAQNCLKWGVGGINIDGCRVGTQNITVNRHSGYNSNSLVESTKGKWKGEQEQVTGRFPANLIHDGSDEVVGLFPQTKSGKLKSDCYEKGRENDSMFAGGGNFTHKGYEADSGSAARFFKTCNYSLRHDTMSVWKTTFVDTAERLLRITQVIKESIAPLNAGDLQEEQNDQLVKSAVSHADTIEILIALVLVRIKSLASNPEGLQAIQDSIGNCKECIQLLSLVLNVVNEENTDITQITTNLWTLFGSVNPAITNSTPETKKLEPKRFAYIPKASRRERNIGCEGLEEKVGGGMKGTEDQTLLTGSGNIRNNLNRNNHPTVKPLALMEYLVKLVSREGQVVLDPFMGSGTTGMACKKLNRDFVGIEMMPEYMEIAKARINGVEGEEQLNML